ncbi:glutathione S-transferase N-terminal domain-containing protein [Pseudomonadales bacterium]|nr:glutathione S-transferase N-terminal domain-containing protein [Pseudomonadales bacterium]
MTVSLTLYYAPGACSIASHIALQEAQIPFDVRSVALDAGEQRSPDFLALNPKGRIPLLMTPFGPLTENPAILEYVASLAPEGQLAPVEDPAKLSRMREFNCFLSATVHVAHAHGPRGERWAKTASALQDMRTQVSNNMLSAFELIEQTLQEGPWVLGDDFSIADAYLYTFARWLEMDRVDTRGLKGVLAHRARMEQRPAVQAVLAEEGIPYSVDRKPRDHG